MEERDQSLGKHRASPSALHLKCVVTMTALPLLLFSVEELKQERDLTTKNEEF